MPPPTPHPYTHQVAFLDPAKLLEALEKMTVGRSQRWWVQPNNRDRGLDAQPDGHDGLPTAFGKATRIRARPGEYHVASVEDLAAFEYASDEDSPAMATSTDAWIALLGSLGAPTDFGVVLKVLQAEMYRAGGQRKALRTLVPHADMIYNFNETKSLLQNTPYAGFWRDRLSEVR